MRHLVLLFFSTTLALIATPSLALVELNVFVRDGGKLLPFSVVGNILPGTNITLAVKSDVDNSGTLTLTKDGITNDLGALEVKAGVLLQVPGDGKSITLGDAGEYFFEFNGREKASVTVLVYDPNIQLDTQTRNTASSLIKEELAERLEKAEKRHANASLDLSGLNYSSDPFSVTPYVSIDAASLEPNLMQTFKADVSSRSSGADIYRKYADSVVLILTDTGLGSGVKIGAREVLTNKHVVGNNTEVFVIQKPDDFDDIEAARRITGKVIKYDEVKDLALVRVNTTLGGRIVDLAEKGDVQVAEKAHAIGHPRGALWSYTEGVVSQIRPKYKWNVGDNKLRQADVIQTQTPINPGNSGGPLFSPAGRLMGINSFGSPDSPGLNFAVAYSSVKEFLSSRVNVVDSPTLNARGSQSSPPREPPNPIQHLTDASRFH